MWSPECHVAVHSTINSIKLMNYYYNLFRSKWGSHSGIYHVALSYQSTMHDIKPVTWEFSVFHHVANTSASIQGPAMFHLLDLPRTEILCSSIKSCTPLSLLWPPFHCYSNNGWQLVYSLEKLHRQPSKNWTYCVGVILRPWFFRTFCILFCWFFHKHRRCLKQSPVQA